jgi:hypothetical protein
MIALDLGPPPGESEKKGTYSSFLIALTCLLIPGLIWVFATTQLFGLSIALAAIHVTGYSLQMGRNNDGAKYERDR